MTSRARQHVLIAVSGLIALLLASCARADTSDPSARTPQRIVSLVPTVTEILFALDAGDRVVGISDYDTYPPEAMDRPRVGALIDPNLEEIFALRPDLVMTYGSQSLLSERLAGAGIETYPYESGSIKHILDSIRDIADRIGSVEAGNALAGEIETALEQVRERASERPPRVLLVHSRDAGTLGSFYTGGSRSYFDELIEIAGGRNIFADVDENAFQPTLEEVLWRSPEVIIELLPSERSSDGRAQRIDDWSRLTTLPAVRNGRVHVLSGDYFMLVGPRLPQAARELAEAVAGSAP
jgi:iron complex transport system substrate-binding protein